MPLVSVNSRPAGLWRLLKLAAPFQAAIAAAVLLGTATVSSSIGLMATSAYIIARAAQHPSVADLAVAIVGVRLFGITRGAFRYLERLVSHHINLSLLASLRVQLYQAIEPRAPALLVRAGHHSGDLLTRMIADIEVLQYFYVRVLGPSLVAAVIAVLMAIYLAGFSIEIAIITFAGMFIVGIGLPVLAASLAHRSNQRLVRVRAQLNVALIDGIQGMADLCAFGRERAQYEQVSLLNREWISVQRRMGSLTAAHNAAGTLVTALAMWVVLLIAIPLVSAARLDGVFLGVLALAVAASFEAVQGLPLAFQYLESGLEAEARLHAVMGDQEPRRESQPEPALVERPLGIHIENLEVRDGPEGGTVLSGVSFEVRPGGSLAIVGPSGAGKSTLLNVLLCFWEYDSGQILVGGRDLRFQDPEEVRRLFSVVPQNTHLFNGTIRENLLLARPEATNEQIQRAARRAQIHRFIESLPKGYETRIGEQGLQLSGGERQRLALARALLKDAPILLLDEPTANLDPVTERAILDEIRSTNENQTMIVVTHRLVGLEPLDEIIMLEKGRIVERGRHEELIQARGLYQRMWELQKRTLRLAAGT